MDSNDIQTKQFCFALSLSLLVCGSDQIHGQCTWNDQSPIMDLAGTCSLPPNNLVQNRKALGRREAMEIVGTANCEYHPDERWGTSHTEQPVIACLHYSLPFVDKLIHSRTRTIATIESSGDYQPHTFTMNNDEAPPGMSFSQIPNSANYEKGGTAEKKGEDATTAAIEYAVQDGEEDFLEELRQQEKLDLDPNHNSTSSTDVMLIDEENPIVEEVSSPKVVGGVEEEAEEEKASFSAGVPRQSCFKKRWVWVLIVVAILVAGVGGAIGAIMADNKGSTSDNSTNNTSKQVSSDGNDEQQGPVDGSVAQDGNKEDDSNMIGNEEESMNSVAPSMTPSGSPMTQEQEQSKEFCTKDSDCGGGDGTGGACALERWTVSSDRVCCTSGSRTGYVDAPDYDVSYLSEYYCTDQEPGLPCFDSSMCAHGKMCIGHVCQGE